MRPGLRTSEFLVALLTVIGAVVSALQGWLSDPAASKLGGAAAIAYVLSRGLAKTETRGPS